MRTPDKDLDLTGVPCPQNAARSLLALASMGTGEIMKVTLDDGEPIALVPESIADEGHAILNREQLADGRWVLWVEAC
ncbi:MAG: sulfurtransferase TusA family protein [Myxococcales bacterium]|nr:sulfurtransferase TusA family protein [Myxococcales bacterium]